MVICPVDSTITERRISHFSAYSRSGTQLYSSDYVASSTVDFNVLNHFSQVGKLVSTGYDLYPISLILPSLLTYGRSLVNGVYMFSIL